MAENKDFREEHISQEEFSFVQHGEKIFDKKFETKPIGYFKDAMIRFTKNRGNVVASIILGIIILLSIFVPILSPKNAEVLEPRVSYLPPRMPLIEDLGVMNGYKEKTDQQVDMSTIGTIEGAPEWWGLPATVDQQFIDMDTLENYWSICNDDDELCIGGQTVLRIDTGNEQMAIETPAITFNALQETTLELDVVDIDGPEGTVLNVYVVNNFLGVGAYEKIASITEPGVYSINPYDELTGAFLWSKVRIEFQSPSTKSSVTLESVKVTDNTQEAPIYSVSGYDLSQLSLVVVPEDDPYYDPEYTFKGTISRSNGERLNSSFSYNAYAEAFGPLNIEVFNKDTFDQMMIDYADVCTLPDTEAGESIVGWEFGEGCPVMVVNGTTEVVELDLNEDGIITDDERFFNYDLDVNYALYQGYDDIPYYIFGTTAQGKDLFKMIWIGARTSLILGLIVSFINISVGIVFGAVSGYYGGTVDLIMQRFSEIMGRIPWLVTLSIFTALIGPGQTTLILVLIINGWIGISSITRTQFYRYKGREYVLASRTLGAKDGRLIFRHILPNGIGTIITSSILSIPAVIFTESTLSYLGFGIGHGQSITIFGLELTGASIGVLLNDGRNELSTDPYLTLWPAVVISILMITFNMFGNALRDAFNPALRGSE